MGWARERFGIGGDDGAESFVIDTGQVIIDPALQIPEEYYGGHESVSGEISQAEAEKKMRANFTISNEVLIMSWPEKLTAGSWIDESETVIGSVGKLSSDGWLFWIDRQYGSSYPHPTYYVMIYGDGFVDIFVGSFTPKIGDDDWLQAGTRANVVQGSLQLGEIPEELASVE
ncbi:MAG TPA: hypothetical protein VJI75_03865 [Candidatus Nanoarchaeia archaeon]|nr:hypothetical protein [Candidatus Nanoarchaeia archaeon]